MNRHWQPSAADTAAGRLPGFGTVTDITVAWSVNLAAPTLHAALIGLATSAPCHSLEHSHRQPLL